MDPRDESRLQDLLDDRLDEASAAALRERLEREPDLRETWNDLQRIRDLVRGPAGSRAPRDFLSGVRAGIAALPAGADVDTDAPRRPDMLAWRRAALAFSAIAALLLVALGVRLMVADEPPVLQDEMLERADAPDLELDRLREQEEATEVAPAREARAGPVAGGAPSPPAPAPARAPGPLGPGDQVQPGLREPTDEVAKSAPPPRRDLGESKAAVRDRKDESGVTLTYAFEAEGLEEGRARLALFVATLDAPAGASEAGGRLVLLPGGAIDGRRGSRGIAALAEVEDASRVLGSVLLSLTPEQAGELARRFSRKAEGKAVGGHETPAATPPVPTAPGSPTPARDAEPEAGMPKVGMPKVGTPKGGQEADADDSRRRPDAAKEPEGDAEESDKRAARVRVRVFVVRPAAD